MSKADAILATPKRTWADRYVESGALSAIPKLKNGQVMLGWRRDERGQRLADILCFCGRIRTTHWHVAVNSQSCGCLTKAILRASRTEHGHSRKDGRNGSRTYSSWGSMWDRCALPSHKSYKDYGGRGIGICERWKSFEAFLADMGERPTGKQLGRIDNDADYGPTNCRWETPRENCNNRRNNKFIEYRGERRTVTEWSRVVGLPYTTVVKRLRDGWSADKAFTHPLRPDRRRAA